jgi:Carboxypeptidase regulatory-like domain
LQSVRRLLIAIKNQLVCLFLICILASSSSLAVDILQVSGTVVDPTGAVIPNAVVVITNVGSSLARVSKTDANGSYEIVAAAGEYRLTVKAPGFQTFSEEGLSLGPTATLCVDAVMKLETLAEQVVVSSGNTMQIDPATTQIGETISQQRMTAVPLNGRSFTDLLALQPGVIPASSAQANSVVMSGCTSTPPSGDLNPGNMSVSGQRETANGFSVNGSSVEEAFNNQAAIVPNLDAIAEFRVLTSNFDAEYGNFSGGQVLVTTRSGTNQLHGSAFWFFRNTNLDARNYFATDRARYDRHQYGGAVGGPLVKDKLFFFADYQGTHMVQGVETGLISVPTALNRVGDLSDSNQLTGTVSGPYLAQILSSRMDKQVETSEPYFYKQGQKSPDGAAYTHDCNTDSACVFPNAIIPQQAWSAPAKALLQYIPKPNYAGGSFLDSSQNQTLNDNKAALHMDWTSKWGALSSYYFSDLYDLDDPYPTAQGGATVPGFNATSKGLAQLINLGWVRPWNATTLNEFHFSYLRGANQIGQPVGGVGVPLASQGFETGADSLGIVALNPAIEGVENISFSDFTIGVDVTGERQVNNTYQWTDNFSKILGRHTLKAGIDLHLDQVNIRSNSINNGAFVFQGTETGLDFADYLIGTPSNYEQGDASPFYIRNHYLGVFAQDSWQARSNLTVNYGLRWDMLPPWHEKFNQLQTFVLDQQSIVYPNAPKGIVFPGDPGVPSTLSPTKLTDFSPRLGVSYSPQFENGFLRAILPPTQSTIRAGYGMFYTAFEGLSAGIMSACAPYGYDYDSTGGRPLFNEPFRSASTGKTNGQPFPSPIPTFGASPNHPNTTVDWSKYNPITGDPAFYYRNVSPYNESYNLSIEREIRSNTIFKVGYIGAGAHHLLVLTPASPGNATLCKSVSRPDQVMEGTPTCGPFSEGGTFTRADGTSIVARGPFGAQFDGITYQKTIGNSSFNALELSVRHTSTPLELMIGYTFSKSIDNSSSLSEEVNPIDPRLSRAISAFDVHQNFVASYTYRLPLAALFRARNRLTEGWSLSGITRFRSGMPVTLYNNDDTSLLGSIPNGINNNGVDTPDYATGDLKLNTNPRSGRTAFNTALISIPNSVADYGHMGTARRRFFHGPGMENFDISLQKSIQLDESKAVDIRIESFNAFNHAQFFGPNAVNGNPDSTNFGRIMNADAPRQTQIAAKFNF